MPSRFLRFLRCEEAASAVEYALIAGLIAAVIATTVGIVGDSVLALFTHSAEEIEKANALPPEN